MKKLLILAIALIVVFTVFQNSYAKTYWRTYEVVEIQSDGIVLKDFEGGRFLIQKDPNKIKGGLQVGDSVKYDSVKNRLKKNPWQPADITSMNNNTITLKLKNGENVDVKMQSKYRNDLNEGEQVYYNASKGQIKKSHLKELEEDE